jgi:hypothetical protein
MKAAGVILNFAFRHYQMLARILAWAGILTIVVLSVVPAEERLLTGFAVPLEHFAAFASVAAAFAIGYDLLLGRMVLLAFLFCAAIEVAQIPLETRHARFSDFIIDFIASCAAIALVYLGRRKKRQAVLPMS